MLINILKTSKVSLLVLFTIFLGSFTLMTQTNAANESDARLHGLYVSEVSSLSPEFNPDTYLYSAYVPSNQSFVNISAVPINENAKVTINGMEPLGELRHTKISLSYGTNTIHISTHIPNTNLTSSYVVVITRQQSGSDNLFDLSFSNLTLDRFFTSEVTNYYGTANPGVRQIGVTPITTNGSSVTINGKNVGSGSTQIVALNNETTIITVLIADSEGVSKTYTINVRRSDISTNASLKSVAVNQKEYTITNSNIMSYVDKGVSGAQLTLIPSDLSSTVKLNGNLIASNTVNVYLDSKQTNIFTITVTAADGITQKTYDLYVLRDLSHGSNVNQVSSTSLGSDTLIEIKNGELVVTEGKGASSTSQRGLNGSRNLIVTLNDTEIIKEINKASSTAKKMKIDYASLMGLDDRLTVKFSKNLLETLRLKGIEIEVLSQNSTLSFLAVNIIGNKNFPESSLTVGRVVSKSRFGSEFIPVTSAIEIAGTGEFSNTASVFGPYTLKMKITVSTGDNRKSNVYKETNSGWSVISSQTLDDEKEAKNLSAGTYIVMDYIKRFTDISNHWAHDIIEFMAKKQIVDGYRDDSFKPNRYITRAEFTTLLVRVLRDNNIEKGNQAASFKDISSSFWAHDYINEGFKLGLITGITLDTFDPDRNISREEMAAIAVRAMHVLKGNNTNALQSNEIASLLNKFKDHNDVSKWARSELAHAVNEKIIDGVLDNHMDPKGKATRAQAVVILYKVLDVTNTL